MAQSAESQDPNLEPPHAPAAASGSTRLSQGEVWLRETGIELIAEPHLLQSVITHRLSAPFEIAPHAHHDLVQFDIVYGAEGIVTHTDRSLTFQKPLALVAYPGDRHGYRLVPLQPDAWVVNIKIDLRAADSISRIEPLPRFSVLTPNDQRLIEDASVLLSLPSGEGPLSFEHILRCLEVLAAWPRGSALGGSGRTDRPMDPPLLRATSLIEDRLDSPPSLDEMAEAAGVSARHLARLFDKHLGQTPHRYLSSRRLDRSKVLLLEHNRTIAEVAFAVGFSSPSTFSRWFGRQTDRTPQEFRRSPEVF